MEVESWMLPIFLELHEHTLWQKFGSKAFKLTSAPQYTLHYFYTTAIKRQASLTDSYQISKQLKEVNTLPYLLSGRQLYFSIN